MARERGLGMIACHNPDEILESTSGDLAEAHAKIDATRKVLQAALDPQDRDQAAIRQAISRLDRIAEELGRVEGSISMPVAHDVQGLD